MAKVKIKQVRSKIGCSARQRGTLEALGLGKINRIVEMEKTPQLVGMINKVNHLVVVEEIK